MYQPPFELTNKMFNLTVAIIEKLSKITSLQSLQSMPILRRNNQIKSIQASLAIEANTLSFNQVRDVIDGKPVIGPPNEIQEVKNAYQAYQHLQTFKYNNQNDLSTAHGMITNLLCDTAGRYRNRDVGSYDGSVLIFMAPPHKRVHQLMNDLFEWLANDQDTPPLVKSCVFHYELVFIHPFADGNGRTARLWQNLILMQWNPIFESIPIESQIHHHRMAYYNVINQCNHAGNSTLFIEFMLNMIDLTLAEIIQTINHAKQNISEQVTKLLEVMELGIAYRANELINLLGIKTRETLRASYLNPAIENGLVTMTLPDKPNSRHQKYRRII